MRTLLNLIIGGLVLWIASRLFPVTVQIDSVGTLILATILIWIVSNIIGILCLTISGIGAIFDNLAWIIIGMILVLFSGVIAMTILSNCLNGFTVVGFWPKVLLSIFFLLFELKEPQA